MGMYDVIEGITVYCARCGKAMVNDFQTKSFDYQFRSLHHYKVGDEIPAERTNDDHIEVHNVCDGCGLFSRVWLKVEDNILTDEFY